MNGCLDRAVLSLGRKPEQHAAPNDILGQRIPFVEAKHQLEKLNVVTSKEPYIDAWF